MAARIIRSSAFFRAATNPAARPLHSSARRLALSEDDQHKDSNSRKGEIDSHKNDSLNKQKDGQGHWKRELASSSEAAVKADREEIKASKENIKKMQEETVGKTGSSK